MELLDSRRLTGLNLWSPGPGAVVDVRFGPEEEPESAIRAWSRALDRMLTALSWSKMPRWVRRHDGGATLVMDAPLDALYAATEINEWAVAEASGEAPDLADTAHAIQASIDEEANPALLELQNAADARGVPFIWDDDAVSLGMGEKSQTWSVGGLPTPSEVPWEQLGPIPVAYITGTNGKTTSTRMTTCIFKAASQCTGSTSSDGVVVDGVRVERGDWTGPGAARRVLRHSDVTLAVLETARGGLLRRGLVVDQCDAALITNIADDHLGEYGVQTLSDMAQAKGLVCQGVRPEGRRVLNADDPLLWALGQTDGPSVCWFSAGAPVGALPAHLESGGEAWILEDDWLVYHHHRVKTPVLRASEIPATFGGSAIHNIYNALGAAALSHALGAELSHVREGLQDFGRRPEDNPGRCQVEELNGVQLLLDFGHNPHGVRAMLKMARGLLSERSGARLWVSLGQAGDRTDSDLHGLAQSVWEARPDRVSLREVAGYERGRAPGEVASILRTVLIDSGQSMAGILHHPDEVSSLTEALEWARSGDLVVHLVHIQRDAVQAFLDGQKR